MLIILGGLQQQHGVLPLVGAGGGDQPVRDGQVGGQHVPVAAARQPAALDTLSGLRRRHGLQAARQRVQLHRPTRTMSLVHSTRRLILHFGLWEENVISVSTVISALACVAPMCNESMSPTRPETAPPPRSYYCYVCRRKKFFHIQTSYFLSKYSLRYGISYGLSSYDGRISHCPIG